MYVSVSNLHFPQMNLASEKPPEAVLEGVIFKIFLEEHTPRPPYIMACPHPLGKFGRPCLRSFEKCLGFCGCLIRSCTAIPINTETLNLTVCEFRRGGGGAYARDKNTSATLR